MSRKVNLKDIPSGFEPIPGGIYEARVTGSEIKEAGENAKHPGSEYISWEFSLTEAPYQNRKVWLNNSLVADALGMLKGTLKGLGFTDDELEDIDIDEILPEAHNRECRVVVTVGKNPNTGEANNSVKRVLPLTEDESVLP